MIKLGRVRQPPGYCGPCALKLVLDYFGKSVPWRKLSKLAKTSPQIGTYHNDLVSAAKKLGFRVIYGDNGSISDLKQHLKKGLPILVGWFAFNEDHFSVVYRITKNYVYLADNEKKVKTGRRKLTLRRFKELWFDFDDRKDPKKKTYRWYMVIKKQEYNMNPIRNRERLR